MHSLHQIEVPSLNRDSLHQLIRDFSKSYKDTHTDEMIKMTEIIPGKPKVDGCKKSDEMTIQWRAKLKEKWQLDKQFNEVSERVLDVIIKKCVGNPLLCMGYFVALVQNGYIRVDASSSVLPTHKFSECEKIKDFLHVPVPRVALRNNLNAIDKYLKSVNEKQNARPGEKEQCIKSCVLLKVATILGDEFDTKSLQAVSPFRTENL